MTDDTVESHAQGDGLGSVINKMPVWFQAFWLVAMTFGIPVLMVGYYLARDAGYIPNPVAAQLEMLKASVASHEASMQRLIDVVGEQTNRLDAMEEDRVMRCVMRAKNDEEKRHCFPKQSIRN